MRAGGTVQLGTSGSAAHSAGPRRAGASAAPAVAAKSYSAAASAAAEGARPDVTAVTAPRAALALTSPSTRSRFPRLRRLFVAPGPRRASRRFVTCSPRTCRVPLAGGRAAHTVERQTGIPRCIGLGHCTGVSRCCRQTCCRRTRPTWTREPLLRRPAQWPLFMSSPPDSGLWSSSYIKSTVFPTSTKRAPFLQWQPRKHSIFHVPPGPTS